MEPPDDVAVSSPVTTGGDLGAAGIEIPGRVRELAERLGRDDAALPAYLYDLDGVAHVAGIRAAIPSGIEVFYAVKANPDPAVLRVVARQADGLEVSSGGELRHAAGAAPGCRLAFGGPGKTTAELASAIRARTFRFHVESPQELYLLSRPPRPRAGQIPLRVNIPADATRGFGFARHGKRAGDGRTPGSVRHGSSFAGSLRGLALSL